jgi:hypothetical protein
MAVDIYKGLWHFLFGVDSSTAPTKSNPLVVNADGSINTVQAAGAPTHVIVDSSALPTGAATSANQTTEIAGLGTINTTLGAPMQETGGSVTAGGGGGGNVFGS